MVRPKEKRERRKAREMSTAEMVANAEGQVANAEAQGSEIPVLPDAQNVNGEGEKKRRGRGKSTKPGKAEYAIPEGGLKTSETPDFSLEKHSKLKEINFSDPLDYRKWEVWYFQQKLAQAEKARDEMAALGQTVEERKAAKESMKVLDTVGKLLGSLEGAQKQRFLELLGEKYSGMVAGA